MLREVKPKNARSARILKQREPQLIENPKSALFLKAINSSALANAVATDIYTLKRPLAIRFAKKNAIRPFEDASSLEFFSQKNDTSLFCFSSSNKKRPHSLTFVRTFDTKVLDMLECLVDPDTTRLMNQFGGAKSRVGTKPLLSFSGSLFEDNRESTSKFRLAKSIFIDFFRGEEVSHIDVEGLQLMLSFTGSEEEQTEPSPRQTVHLRAWRIVTKRSGHRVPRVELEEIGPRIDFRLGRCHNANESVMKDSLKQSKKQDSRPHKNVELDLMGDKIGRVHMLKQNLNDLQTRKMKGLKRDSGEALAGPDDLDMSSESDGELSDRLKHDHDLLQVVHEGETARPAAMLEMTSQKRATENARGPKRPKKY